MSVTGTSVVTVGRGVKGEAVRGATIGGDSVGATVGGEGLGGATVGGESVGGEGVGGEAVSGGKVGGNGVAGARDEKAPPPQVQHASAAAKRLSVSFLEEMHARMFTSATSHVVPSSSAHFDPSNKV